MYTTQKKDYLRENIYVFRYKGGDRTILLKMWVKEMVPK
jgi:hypothetical protein